MEFGWDQTLVELAGQERIAILAGAGVSLDAPANLIDGRTFVESILRKACPESVSPDWLVDRCNPPRQRRHRPGEMLRFEQLMMSLSESIDPELTVLDCLNAATEPNRNHFALAGLIRAGHVVITTNFDTLIETAYERAAGLWARRLNVAAYDADFPNEWERRSRRPTLWKIHGSLSVRGRPSVDSIRTTQFTLLANRSADRRLEFLRGVLKRFDLVVVGYSGMDDFDIVPTIAETPSAKRIVWVDHGADTPPLQHPPTVAGNSTQTRWSQDAVGRARVLFNQDVKGEEIRASTDIRLVTADTGKLLGTLAARLRASQSFLEARLGPPCRFGRAFPDDVQGFFDRWLDGLAPSPSSRHRFVLDVTQLLFNRPFEAEDVEIVRQVSSEYRTLLTAPGCSPQDKLEHLRLSFNEGPGADRLVQIERELRSLLRELPRESEALGLRLLGLIVASLRYGSGDPSESIELLQRSAAVADAMGQHSQQVDSLYALSDAYLSKFELGMSAAYAERANRLAEQIGYQTNSWTQAMESDLDVQLRAHQPRDLLAQYESARRIAVDVGDSLGEAQATYRIACLKLAAGLDHKEVSCELLRAERLIRYLDLGLQDMFSGVLSRWPPLEELRLQDEFVTSDVERVESSMFVGGQE